MNWIIAHFEIVFGGTLAIFAVLLLVQKRRSPQSTAAWLLFVFLAPYIALPAFLMFGVRKPKSARQLKFFDRPEVPPVRSDLDETFRAYGLPPAQSGNRFQLLTTGEDAYAALRDMIHKAKRSIDCEFYIVANDPVGTAFVELLADRARAGVRVRLLVDYFGGLSRPRDALRKLEEAGGEVLLSLPFLGLPGSGRINLRNHRKTLIVDDCSAFAGGMNIGLDYMSLGDGSAPAQWTDLSFLIEGPAVEVYREVLFSDIRAAQRHQGAQADAICALPASENEGAILQPVASGPDFLMDALHDGIVSAIYRARRRVYIVTPYFLPTDHLSHALYIACQRGLDVRLLVPEKSNQSLANLARGSYLRTFRDVGGRVFMLKGGMIHAKAGIIDDPGMGRIRQFRRTIHVSQLRDRNIHP